MRVCFSPSSSVANWRAAHAWDVDAVAAMVQPRAKALKAFAIERKYAVLPFLVISGEFSRRWWRKRASRERMKKGPPATRMQIRIRCWMTTAGERRGSIARSSEEVMDLLRATAISPAPVLAVVTQVGVPSLAVVEAHMPVV
jgi:hypothetical protein